MKTVKCEICGSISLTKTDGFFVCDYCGTKYTIEEAKKMMFEGKVNVSGSTIQIDSSNQIRGKLQLAVDAFEDEDLDRAYKLADEVLENDPTVSDAWYIKALIYRNKNNIAFERFRDRGAEYESGNLGLMSGERFEKLLQRVGMAAINIGFINQTKHRYVTVKSDGEIMMQRVPKDQAM